MRADRAFDRERSFTSPGWQIDCRDSSQPEIAVVGASNEIRLFVVNFMEHVVDGFCRRKEGGESSHKVQCKKLVEIRTKYVEKAKMAEFGVS